MTDLTGGLGRERYDELIRQREEAIASEPSCPLDGLQQVFEGDPTHAEYLAPVRDLLSNSPAAAENAGQLANDGLLREGLGALLELHTQGMAGDLDTELMRDRILRFSQAVVQTRLIGPNAKSIILANMQAAVTGWFERGAQRGQASE